jgi:hypothetical protein
VLPFDLKYIGLLPRFQSAKSLAMAKTNEELIAFLTDYTLANPDTLTKYKQAGQISQKVLQTVSGIF